MDSTTHHAPMNGAAPPEADPTPAVAPTSPADGASSASPATGEAAPLTPYQRRKQLEREREEAAAARKARRAAKTTKPAAEAEKKPAAAAEDDGRDEEQRKRETGGFWQLTLRVVSLLLWPFGWQLEPLSKDELREDVALLAPLARRHKWLDVLVRYAALPYLLAERVLAKAKRRESKGAAEKKGGAP